MNTPEYRKAYLANFKLDAKNNVFLVGNNKKSVHNTSKPKTNTSTIKSNTIYELKKIKK